MKSVLALVLLFSSITTFAKDDYNFDMTEQYLSWCDGNNVISAASTATNIVVLQNCAAEQLTCQMDQRTSGKKVYYSASCVDTSRPNEHERKTNSQ